MKSFSLRQTRKVIILVFFVRNLFGLINCTAQNISTGQKTDIGSSVPVIKNKVKHVQTLFSPDTVKGDYLVRISGLAFVPPNMLYLADGLEKAVRVFDSNTGKEKNKFGKAGRGPGEFLSISGIYYQPPENIIVVDNILRRVTIFDLKGKLSNTFGIKESIDGFLLYRDKAFMSSFLIKEDHKPLKILSVKDGSILEEFGTIVEPQKGLFEKLKKAGRAGAQSKDALSSVGMTSFVFSPDFSRIFLLQRNPYRLVSYDIITKQERDFAKPVPFSVESNFIFEYENTPQRISATKSLLPSGAAIGISVFHSYLIAVIISADGEEAYVDCYDFNTNFKFRLQIPPLPHNVGTQYLKSTIGESSDLYVLLRDRDQVSWVEKYKIEIP